MDLQTYYLSSVSVAATLGSVVLITLAVLGIWFAIRLKKVLDKVDRLTDTTSEMAGNVNELVHVTTRRILTIEKAFLTAQGIGQLAQLVVNAFSDRRAHKKGADHETE
jgi:threonine/homoserine efflux transporter RhtA